MTRPDPPRLLGQSDTPDALREALRGARGDLPSPDRLDRLAGRLGPPFSDPTPPSGSSPAPPATPAPSTAPASASLTSTVIAPALVSGALTLGLLGAVGLWPVSSPAPAPPAPSALVAPSAPSPMDAAGTQSGTSIRPAAPRPTPPADPSSAATAPRPALAPDLPAAATESNLPPTAAGATGDLQPGPDLPDDPAGQPSPATREPEASLLHRAREALASSPSAALDRVAEHERLYPGGVLTQEREVLAIEALVRQGRTADARARAARFATQFPRSAHLRRLQTLVPDLPAGP